MEGQRKIRKWIVMFAAFFLILITGSEKKVCAETVDTFSINLKVTEYYDRANQVLDYVNEERKRLGVQPLVLDADLQEAAMQRAAEQYVENCSFGGSSTVGGAYQFPYQTAVPLYLIYRSKTTGMRGKQLDAFSIRSLTPEIAEVADGMICAKASGKVVLQVRLKQEPSVAWSVSFSIQTKISERQPESEQLSKAASDQAPAKTEKTVITKQKLPKIAITSLRSKKKGQLIIRWKKKQGIGGYEVQYGTQKTFKRAKIKKISGKGKTGITLKKMKRKSTYYVRMRSWKMVQGRCVYGAWSKVCKIKVK